MSVTAEVGPKPVSLRRNAISNMAARAAAVLAWVVVTPYVLRRLGPERFGVWSLFFAVTGYMAALDFGMSAGVGRFVPMAVARRDRSLARQVILRSLALSALLGAAWMILCLSTRGIFVRVFHVPDLWTREVQASLNVFGLSLFALSVAQVLQWALVGFQRFDLYNVHVLVGLAANVAVLVSGLAAGWGLMAAALAMAVGQGVTALLAGRASRRELSSVGGESSGTRITWRDLLGYGGMMQIAAALGAAQAQAGKVLLGALGSLTWVTHFELAYRVAIGLWSLPVLIQLAVVPAAALAAERGLAELREIYAWCCRWVFSLSAWVLGALWVVSPALLPLWVGTPQPQAVDTARWLSVSFAVWALSGPATAVARGAGWPGLEALLYGIALVVNAALCVVAIPRLEAPGAAIALGVSFVAAGAVLLVQVHRRLEISTLGWLARTALPRFVPAAIATAAVVPIRFRVQGASRWALLVTTLVQGAIFTVLFIALLWPTGDPRAVWLRGRQWWTSRRSRGDRVS